VSGTRLTTPRNTILIGDALSELRRLPAGAVDTVLTSPPYHLLRSYDAGPQELGREPSVDDYVTAVLAVTAELARVLKPTGSLWLNLGEEPAPGAGAHPGWPGGAGLDRAEQGHLGEVERHAELGW
jgi:site-specific DNA-methyltransferase (adenine-specific)